MLDLRQIPSDAQLSTLQDEHRERDAEVQRLRDEMLVLHRRMEPHWERIQRAAAGPSHLAQGVGVGIPDIKLGGM